MDRSAGVAFNREGAKGPLLVLLHGLAATGAVWSPFVASRQAWWPGAILTVDLPGHGASARLASYGIDDYAAALALPIATQADGRPVTILGHSLGGAVALALARKRREFHLAAVLGLGIKVDWQDDELQRLHALSSRPPRVFQAEAEALAQHGKMSGLIEAEDSLLERGVAKAEGGWMLSVDPAAFNVKPPPVAAMMATAVCDVHLACGEDDAMVTQSALRRFDRGAQSIACAGHNAMVDRPDAVWTWLRGGAG